MLLHWESGLGCKMAKLLCLPGVQAQEVPPHPEPHIVQIWVITEIMSPAPLRLTYITGYYWHTNDIITYAFGVQVHVDIKKKQQEIWTWRHLKLYRPRTGSLLSPSTGNRGRKGIFARYYLSFPVSATGPERCSGWLYWKLPRDQEGQDTCTTSVLSPPEVIHMLSLCAILQPEPRPRSIQINCTLCDWKPTTFLTTFPPKRMAFWEDSIPHCLPQGQRNQPFLQKDINYHLNITWHLLGGAGQSIYVFIYLF